MISENAKTFKVASVSISSICERPEVKKFFSTVHVQGQFNLEKAPWWGGAFKRMIKSAKRCLRKSIGKTCLTFDELLTLVTEVEGVLNSRPLTYIYSDDVTEALTPSHLLVGYRILSLPDATEHETHDEDYSPENLTRRASHLARTLDTFWKRWKQEYLLELREFHRTRQQRGATYTLQVGEVVTVYDEGHPRGMWRLGRIEELIPSSDDKLRGVRIRVISKGGQVKIIRRPVQHIYPLEVRTDPQETQHTNVSDRPTENVVVRARSTTNADRPTKNVVVRARLTRKAALQAKDRITECLIEDDELIN